MKSTARSDQRRLGQFVESIATLSALPAARTHRALVLDEYPFDSQLLQLSRMYRWSRELFVRNGGSFSPKLFSLERSVGDQDLFSNVVEFAPIFTELRWFKDNHRRLMDPVGEMNALRHFNAIPLFHEQNHRVLWHLLPPSASGEQNLLRYLKFVESLVIALDVALAEEVGRLSTPFNRMGVLYRTVNEGWSSQPKAERRRYLRAIFYTAYCRLELVGRTHLREAVDHVLPDQPTLNGKAVRSSFEIADFFVEVATPEWLRCHATSSGIKLKKLHRGSTRAPLRLPEDPLAVGPDLFACVDSVFDHFLG